jgi:hypothetical protein
VSASLDHIIEAVRALDGDEQRQLRAIIDSLPSTPTQKAMGDEVADLLFRQGLITHIPSLAERTAAKADRRRVPVQGTPVSQTIIEERR